VVFLVASSRVDDEIRDLRCQDDRGHAVVFNILPFHNFYKVSCEIRNLKVEM